MLASLIWRIVTVYPVAQIVMHIVAIAWIYVVLMMSVAERSFIAGIMTFLLYGVLPLVVILYLMGTGQRKRKRAQAEKPAPQPGQSRSDDAPVTHDTESGR